MPLEERRARHDAMFQVLLTNDAKSWGERFLTALALPLALPSWSGKSIPAQVRSSIAITIYVAATADAASLMAIADCEFGGQHHPFLDEEIARHCRELLFFVSIRRHHMETMMATVMATREITASA